MASLDLLAQLYSIVSVQHDLNLILTVIYLFWAFIPDSVLSKIGISWYPAKDWALALPAFFIITIVAAQIMYQGLNMMYTKPFSSIYSIQGTFFEN